MSVSITVSEETYNKLKASAQVRGKENVEQLLEDWEDEQAVEWQKELDRRKEVGDKIKAFRKKMHEKYGVMPDSTELIREDRQR
jgi:quinol monooxygenase YgiN